MDFIRNNLRTSEPQVDAQALADQVKANIDATEVPPVAQSETKTPAVAAKDSGDDQFVHIEETPNAPAKTETPLTPDDGIDVPNVPAAENFKRLRAKVRDQIQTVTDLQTEKEALTKSLEDYKSGKVVPETLQAMEQRIGELEHFEKLHSLKTSKEYREKFVKPLDSLYNKISAIATDYGVPNEVLNQALGLKNKELNQFLQNNFDAVGALEVKGLINQAQEIQENAVTAEREPLKVLEDLRNQNTQFEEVRHQERKAAIASRSKDAWVKALGSIREEGKAAELIYRDNDSEHNENFVKPVVTAAAREYGKIVRQLAEGGLESLPEEVAYALSRMVLLAHASAVSIETRERAVTRARELEENTRRSNKYNRPSIGGFGNSGSGAQPAQPSSPNEAAELLLNKVLSRR